MTNYNDLRSHTTSSAGFISLEDLLEPSVVRDLTAPHDLRSTGYPILDGLLMGGLARGDLVVVGGRPGVGKSVALIHWARNLAASGRNVLLATYEHSELFVLAQLLLVELGEIVATPIESVGARNAIEAMVSGSRTWADTVTSDPTLTMAARNLGKYSANLRILDSSGRHGGIAALEAEMAANPAEVFVVDHLQKLGLEGGLAAAWCKQLAVRTESTGLTASITSTTGIASKRIRAATLVDAAPIAHEADVVLMLNDKLSIVSRNHAAFDSVRAETFRNQVVFTIEKNRRGSAGIDLEFERDFAHRRFKPDGSFVSERLVDDIMVRE